MDVRALSWALVGPAAGGLVLAVQPAVQARTEPVTAWVHKHAVELRTVDPGASLADLEHLRRSVGDASIVGLGESAHGAAEETTLKHRTLRLLVERMGFRSVAWEDDWTMGPAVNAYIGGGRGDLKALMREMSDQYQTRQVADVLRWLRAFNAGRKDKVRFVGVEYYFTRRSAYDAVEAYVAKVAPRRLKELQGHLNEIRPGANIRTYANDYRAIKNKRPYIRHARRVHEIVSGLPRRDGLALHNARQIVSFYEFYALPQNDALTDRDARAAENVRWWRGRTGDKVAYWAASAHIANAPGLRIFVPPAPELRYATAGSHLRRWYGVRYRSIGFTFDHGRLGTGPLPPPEEDWFERPFGNVDAQTFTLDLRTPAPAPVRTWLAGPIKTRGLTHAGPASYMTGGSLKQWFDVIVHRQEISPAGSP